MLYQLSYRPEALHWEALLTRLFQDNIALHLPNRIARPAMSQ